MAEPLLLSSGMRILVALLAMFGIAVATISTNIAANVVSPANDFANLAPRHISFRTGGLITGIIGIVMMPWKLLATVGSYIFTWLVGYSALLGPIAGIMIADYWIVRRRELDVADLYRPKGQYRGVSWQAVTALVLAVAPNVPGFLKAAGAFAGEPTIFDAIYPYAWFIGFAIGFCVYVATKRLGAAPAPAQAPTPGA
jgi:NCS1 family nucleobase:cation symporter-1